jgi:hypothetical protein
MNVFNLPHTTRVGKVIPKNAFDQFVNTKQKRMFSDVVQRITWVNKLAPETVNLEARDIEEIQVFRIELKANEDYQPLLDIIDKAIPYQIIFVLEFQGKLCISTSSKHQHPINKDQAVIDWTFKSDWFAPTDNKYTLQLKGSIDAVYHAFCSQLSAKPLPAGTSIQNLIDYSKQVDALEKEISKLKRSIVSCKQFNQKVELNMQVKKLEQKLRAFIESGAS